MLKLVRKPLEERNSYEGLVMRKFIEMELGKKQIIARAQFRLDNESPTQQELVGIDALEHKEGLSLLVNTKTTNSNLPFLGSFELILSPLDARKLLQILGQHAKDDH